MLPGQTSLCPLVSFFKVSVFSQGVLHTFCGSTIIVLLPYSLRLPWPHTFHGWRRSCADGLFVTGQQAILLLLDRWRPSQLNFGDPWVSAFQWYESVLLSANRRPDSFKVLYVAALDSFAGSVYKPIISNLIPIIFTHLPLLYKQNFCIPIFFHF